MLSQVHNIETLQEQVEKLASLVSALGVEVDLSGIRDLPEQIARSELANALALLRTILEIHPVALSTCEVKHVTKPYSQLFFVKRLGDETLRGILGVRYGIWLEYARPGLDREVARKAAHELVEYLRLPRSYVDLVAGELTKYARDRVKFYVSTYNFELEPTLDLSFSSTSTYQLWLSLPSLRVSYEKFKRAFEEAAKKIYEELYSYVKNLPHVRELLSLLRLAYEKFLEHWRALTWLRLP